jgi:hypothetical protein
MEEMTKSEQIDESFYAIALRRVNEYVFLIIC